MSTINPNVPSVGKPLTSPPAVKPKTELEKQQTESFEQIYKDFYAQLKGPTVKTDFLNRSKNDDNRSLGLA